MPDATDRIDGQSVTEEENTQDAHNRREQWARTFVPGRRESDADPTANVVALHAAESHYRDGLRISDALLADVRLKHIEFVANLRALHQEKMDHAETSRVNANRAADTQAAATAAERAASTASVLAQTTAANAENLRTQLATTATTMATQLTATINPILEQIQALQRNYYEGKGKQSYSDPQMLELAASVKALAAAQMSSAGRQEGKGSITGVLWGMGGTVLTALIIAAVLSLARLVQPSIIQAPPAIVQSPPPVVVEVPAPRHPVRTP